MVPRPLPDFYLGFFFTECHVLLCQQSWHGTFHFLLLFPDESSVVLQNALLTPLNSGLSLPGLPVTMELFLLTTLHRQLHPAEQEKTKAWSGLNNCRGFDGACRPPPCLFEREWTCCIWAGGHRSQQALWVKSLDHQLHPEEQGSSKV